MGMAFRLRFLYALFVFNFGLMRLPVWGQEHCPATPSDTSFPPWAITRVVGLAHRGNSPPMAA